MSELFLGLLSGTSMDGVDAALVEFDPAPRMIASHFLALPPDLRRDLLRLAVPGADEIDTLGAADVSVARAFAQAANELLAAAGVPAARVTALGSHGQTIRHRPTRQPAFTLQIGDPNTLAALTGIPVVADFRRKDMALGGQGAPLVPAFHDAVFRAPGRDRVVLNLGGIANVTILPGDPGQPVGGFDTGPGNTLLDAWCRRHRGEPMDRDGVWAASGQAKPDLLAALLGDPFFSRVPPKSTGPEQFSLAWLDGHLAGGASPADVQSTLVELTVEAVVREIRRHAPPTGEVFACGGGARNRFLMDRLRAKLGGITLGTTDELGVPVDWVEAVAFAWLARQRWLGLPGNLPAVTGASRPAILGGVYLPG